MKCKVCGRQLREDSNYCDFCGAKVPEQPAEESEYKKVLDVNFLLIGVLVSIGITLLITLIVSGAGVPIFFGGLFLPFFFKMKKIKNQ